MAWNVNSVVDLPSNPASNFMVGTQRPKSKPEIVEATKPGNTPTVADDDAASAALAVELAVAATAAAALVEATTAADEARVTVTSVVDPQCTAAADELAGAVVLVSTVDATTAVADPEAGAAPAVPSAAFVVKFEKPCAAITWATLMPVLEKAVLREVAEFAFSVAEPPTAGSTRGTIPRRATVVGRVGSLQMEGTSTTKGLKFCSAATRPWAAAMESAPVPRVATIKSACVSCLMLAFRTIPSLSKISSTFAHGLAAARRVLTD